MIKVYIYCTVKNLKRLFILSIINVGQSNYFFHFSWLWESSIPVHQWLYPVSLHLPWISICQLPCQAWYWSPNWPGHGIQAEEGGSLCIRCSLHSRTGLMVKVNHFKPQFVYCCRHLFNKLFFYWYSVSMLSVNPTTSPRNSALSTQAGNSVAVHSELERLSWRTSSTTFLTLVSLGLSWL